MRKRSKLVYVLGSISIGIITLLSVIVTLLLTGVIGVSKNQLIFVSESAEFVYDGEAHNHEKWSMVSGELKKGHTAAVAMEATQTEIGSISNDMIITILDENDADVTDYYDIETQAGVLTVISKNISITSDSKKKFYDGTALFADEDGYTMQGDLASGCYLDMQFTAEVTDAGIVENSFNVKVFNENGEDKTASYSITKTFGFLEVVKRPIKVKSDDISAVYDGTAKSGEGTASTIDGSTITGHELKFFFDEGRIDAGTEENDFYALVYDGENVDVTANYKIDYVSFGDLVVEPRPLSVTVEGREVKYSGNPLTGNVDDDGNLKLNEEGGYVMDGELVEGQTLVVKSAGSEITNVFRDENGNVSGVENAATYHIYDAAGNEVTKNYDVDYSAGFLKILPLSVTLTSTDGSKQFDGTPFGVDENTDVEISGDDRNFIPMGQSFIYDFTVRANDTVVFITDGAEGDGKLENTFDFKVLVDGSEMDETTGFNYTDNYDVTPKYGSLSITPREITIITDDASKVFNGEPLTQHSYTQGADFWLFGGNEFHTAHTLGAIPYIGSITYITNENDGGKVKNSVRLNGDGLPDIQVLSGNADVSENYSIKVVEGTLTLFSRRLDVYTLAKSKTYDGKELTGNTDLFGYLTADVDGGYSVKTDYGAEEGGLVNGNFIRLTPSANAKLTNAGSVKNEAIANVFTVIDKGGVLTEVDITASYGITYEYNSLTVNKKPLTVKMKSNATENEKLYYNGKEQSYVKYDADAPISGHKVEVIPNSETKGKIPGENVNEARFKVVLSAGAPALGSFDVNDNYAITVETGIITILPKPATLKVDGKEIIYNGKELKNDSYNATSDNYLVEGHAWSVSGYPTITNVGSVVNQPTSISIIDEFGEDVTLYYTIEKDFKNLVVKVKKLTLSTSGENEKTYDGKEFTSDNAGFYCEGVVSGEELQYTPASLTNVGVITNMLYNVEVVKAGTTTKTTDNYEIEKRFYGTLSILPITIEVTTTKDSKIYDGKALESKQGVNFDLLVSAEIPEDEILTFRPASIVDAGQVPNILTDINVTKNDVSTLANYYIIPQTNPSYLIVEHVQIEINSIYDYKVYDGEPLVAKEDENIMFNRSAVAGETMSFSLSEITDVGKVKNQLNDLTITSDSTGLSTIHNYNITYRSKACLEILPLEITLVAPNKFMTTDEFKVYKETTGRTALTLIAGEDIVEISAETPLVDGQTLQGYGYQGGLEDVGIGQCLVKNIVIADASGHDCTHNYSITVEGGMLAILKDMPKITLRLKNIYVHTDSVTANSEYKPTDCELLGLAALEAFGYKVVSLDKDNLATPIYIRSGESKVGYYELEINPEAINIVDRNGDPVTPAYEVANLQVYDKEITVKTLNASKTYDGTPLTFTSWVNMQANSSAYKEIIDWNGNNGYTAELTYISSITAWGSTANDFTIIIKDGLGTDVTAQFKVNRDLGTLTINKKLLTLTSATSEITTSDVAYYEQYPLTNPTIATKDGLVIGDYVNESAIKFTGKQADIGSSANTFEVNSVKIVNAKGEDVTDCYQIIPIYGNLIINAEQI